LNAAVAYRSVSSPTDPVCPECGDAVGSTSTYCMHCDAEFDAPIDASEFTGGSATTDQTGGADGWGGTDQGALEDDGDWGDSDEAVTEHPSGWDEGGPGDVGHTDGWSPEDDPAASTTGDATSTESTATESTTGADPTPESVSDYGTTGETSTDTGGTATSGSAEREDGGTGRNLLQSLARIGAVLLTVVVGLVTTGALMLVTVEAISLWMPLVLVGLVGIVTGGIVIARQDTGIDALADALYVTAAAVVGLPFVFFLLLPTDQAITGRLLFGLVGSFMGAFVGVPAFVIGYVLQPDDEGLPWT
jgi:hypothetical protein